LASGLFLGLNAGILHRVGAGLLAGNGDLGLAELALIRLMNQLLGLLPCVVSAFRELCQRQ